MRFMLVAVLALTTSLLAVAQEPAKRLGEAATVFSEVMATPNKGIPKDLLEKANCIVLVPGLKTGAFIVGGKYGKGFLSCRTKSGSGWSAPASVRIEGGSIGFQIGGSSTDLIMLVMSDRGADKLLSSKFTLGADHGMLFIARPHHQRAKPGVLVDGCGSAAQHSPFRNTLADPIG